MKNRDAFAEWLKTYVNINPYSVGRYSKAIDTISSELTDYGIEQNVNLFDLTEPAIIEKIMKNPEFKLKNDKGHRMYSSALNHLKKYIEHYYDSELQTILPRGEGSVTKEDTILIKIGVSYKAEITSEELYHATSVSWIIAENRLSSGEIKYYCAVYNNEIKEVYRLTGYEKDVHPDNIGRFILIGELAEESIRSKLHEHNVRDIHKGSGNPIKYVKMEDLLTRVNTGMEVDILSGDEKAEDKQLIKLLLKRLAENKNELRTLSTNNPNWITKVNDAGIYVENETSREKFTKGEKKNPFSFITYDFLLTAWEEFIKVRSASTKDFIETKGSSSFIMGFFHELPFVETELKDNNYFIKLKEFTTDRLPESTLKQTLKLLTEIINEELDPKTISQKFKEDSIKRLKLRARQGLKILGFLSEEYKIQQQILNEYIDTRNTDVFLSKRMLRHPYLKITYQLLSLLTGIGKAEKVNLLTEIGMVLVRNSLGSNLMVHSVAQNRTRNILNWFKEIGLVDEEWNVLDNKFDGRYTLTPSASLVREEQIKITIFDLVNHINQYIANKGFFYRKEEVINLFLSLKTKPFVIISGISGTGKTKIVQWFAESVGATEKNGQFTLIPVRPDWSDSSDLLGYVDIKGDFKKGKLTEVILNARENENLPYFVLLDEMNLARVEYYFSDLLSVMESRKWDEGEMVSSTLLSEKTAGKKIILPNNLYIIGTVNMDETTHPFSKKVLDRANTIEFNRVELGNLSFLQELDEIEPVKVNQELFASKYLHLKDAYKSNEQLIKTITDELILINNALQRINAHIGYRVRDEICFYLSYNEESQLMPFEQALDHCILQKILPRIAGSDGRVETLLKELFSLFTRMEYVEELDVQYDFKNAPYPASAAKVVEMLRRLQEDGFTSFWIS